MLRFHKLKKLILKLILKTSLNKGSIIFLTLNPQFHNIVYIKFSIKLCLDDGHQMLRLEKESSFANFCQWKMTLQASLRFPFTDEL